MSFERGFPTSEFETRVQNAQTRMKAASLDAMLFMTEREFTYFAGFSKLVVAGAPAKILTGVSPFPKSNLFLKQSKV